MYRLIGCVVCLFVLLCELLLCGDRFCRVFSVPCLFACFVFVLRLCLCNRVCVSSFVCVLVCLFVLCVSCVRAFACRFAHLFVCSFACLLVCSFVGSFVRLCVRLFVCVFVRLCAPFVCLLVVFVRLAISVFDYLVVCLC